MRIHRAESEHCAGLRGAVVVIDVLRSFTTAAVALAHGAREVVAVGSIDDALRWAARDPEAITVGAVPGGLRAPGLQHGNTPSGIEALGLRGRRVVQYTAGGTRALVACDGASVLLAASLVCARATAAHLLRLAPAQVTLVSTGTWVDRDGDEDHACADLIESLLRGNDPPRAPFAARVRESDFGRRFGAAVHPHLPAADLDCCAAADRYDFAMPVQRTPSGLVLRRTFAAAPAG
jgi:2-phosphosulfolactate phosphatase